MQRFCSETSEDGASTMSHVRGSQQGKSHAYLEADSGARQGTRATSPATGQLHQQGTEAASEQRPIATTESLQLLDVPQRFADGALVLRPGPRSSAT